MNLIARILIFLLIFSSAALAQSTRPTLLGDALEVSLITIGPGAQAYEAFGHNALVIRNRFNGASAAYNYGVFDFDQKNFYWRFIQGRMLYTMDLFAVEPMLADYIANDRTVWEQVLNLSADQKLALLDYLDNNARPQNKDYLYDYYRNNCSTKVRDALDSAGVLDGFIHQQTAAVFPGTTYRWHTRRLTVGTPPLYIALEAVLGRPVDRPISRWEEMFLPDKLRDFIRDATIISTSGQPVPLLKSERLLHRSSRFVDRTAPPNVVWKYLLAGMVYAGVLMSLGRRLSAGRWARKIWGALAVLWMAVAGFGGAFGIWAWFFTNHSAAAHNENLLSLNVALIALIALTPPALARRHRGLKLARLLAVFVAATAVLGLLLKALPAFYQYNWDILALAIPIQLSIAWTLWRLVPPPAEISSHSKSQHLQSKAQERTHER